MPTETHIPPKDTRKEAEVSALMKQMAKVLRNMRTYQPNNPVLQKSFAVLLERLGSFLSTNESLTLLVREYDLIYGNSVVYSSEDKLDSLAFSLYKDGIRLVSFRDGVPRRELQHFLLALNDAREADPYQADLVTILWEKDLDFISYRAVDAYLEDDEKRRIDRLVQKCSTDPPPKPEGDTLPSSEFFIKELGISPEHEGVRPRGHLRTVREGEVRRIVREILDEEDQAILRRCSEICLEILGMAPREDTFNRVVDFLGRICAWLASSGDFLSACTIISDLRAIAERPDLPRTMRSSIMDTITRLGERRRIRSIGEQISDLPEARLEEVFAYLALMPATAVEPLSEILADCDIRKVRYLLCRVISVVAKSEPERLKYCLQDKRWFFVRNTVMVLGMMANPASVPLMKIALSHPEARVRREVARSLGRIRNPMGLELLRSLVRDDNKMVRVASLAAIRDIGSDQARGFIEDLVTDKSFSKRSADEKREIMRTYGGLGQDGLEFLTRIADGRLEGMDDKSRVASIYGIAMVPGKETLRLLTYYANEGDSAMRYAAAEALATIEQGLEMRGDHEV
jgi:hypothetical protein